MIKTNLTILRHYMRLATIKKVVISEILLYFIFIDMTQLRQLPNTKPHYQPNKTNA